MSEAERRYDVFFSYHWRDHAAVEDVARRLKDRSLRVFLDRWYLTPGQPWPQELEKALGACRAVAVFLGPDGLGPWQQREQHLALDRQGRDADFPVIPILLAGSDPPLGFLKLNTWIDLRGGIDDGALAVLCAAVRGEPPGPDARTRIEEAFATVCPYRGLRPFREEDAAFFCGREAFTEKLVDAVGRQSLVAVVGASGSGKSSVVRAGLIPKLREGAAGKTWEVATMVPGDRPLHVLAACLVPILEPDLSRVDRRAEINKLAGHLAEGTIALRDVAADVLEAQPGTDRLLLFVDQWEELYTLAEDEDTRQRFLAEILDATATEHVSVVLTLRGDFYGRALSDREFADRLQDAVVNLGPMTRDELARSITVPAEKFGLGFEPAALVEDILDDVGKEPGNLPLLEFVLEELWQARRGGALHQDAYRSMGRVQGAIAHRADEIFDNLDPAQRNLAPRVLIRMVRPGEGTADTRHRAPLPLDDDALSVIRRLADARLVVTGRDDTTGEQTVEVTHEALIQNWARLQGWVHRDREFLRTRWRVEAAATQWDKDGRTPDRLLPEGRPLAEAEDILANRRDDLGPHLIEHIEASTNNSNRQKRAKRLIVGGVMAALMLLTAMASWFGYNASVKERDARDQRQIALSRQLAAEAIVLADRGRGDTIIERAAAFAVESWRRMKNPQAAKAANRLVDMLPSLRIEHGSFVQSVAFSPDGRRLATASEDNTARLIGTESGTEVARIVHGGSVRSVAFSPDGRWLATASRDNTARLIETESGAEVARIEHGAGVESVAFSPDGRWLATKSQDNTARLIETESGAEVARIEHGGDVRSVAFSPDGRWLATNSNDNTARLIETESGAEVARIEHGDYVKSVAFSPDGRWLATASWDNTARLIETESGTEVARIEHGDDVISVAFSPDGRWLATASADNTARLIETESGTEVARIEHGDDVISVAFSPDGRWLATGSEDKTTRLLWADPRRVFDILCQRAGQNLTRAEWNTYIGADEPWRPTCPNWRNPDDIGLAR